MIVAFFKGFLDETGRKQNGKTKSSQKNDVEGACSRLPKLDGK